MFREWKPAPGTTGKGLSDDELVEKDTAYSPSSGRESERLQNEDRSDELAEDGIDPSRVKILPGTGGPDDTGDIRPAPGEPRLRGQ